MKLGNDEQACIINRMREIIDLTITDSTVGRPPHTVASSPQ